MTLPLAFIEKYRDLLGQEAEDFLASFDQAPQAAYRLNPLKNLSDTYPDPIPGTPWGYYGKLSGKSLDFVTGLAYSQEPAAQMVAQIAQPRQGDRVLDLAAAPGGKSTHLLAYLANTGLLVSNEISSKRSKILVENLERFGARNVVATNESADRLAKVFPAYFDLIVFDGPCSGEGMFRKDPDACAYWHEGYPAQCADLQKSILADALSMLTPGGRLVYSTCTWSPEENEGVVSWLLENYDLELIEIPKLNGMVAGIGQEAVARMYPHRFRGEGQFVAHFQDRRPAGNAQKVKSGKSNLTKDQLTYWQDFAKKSLKTKLTGLLQVFGDQLYLLPDGLPDLSKLKIARNGLHLGTFKTKRFEPSLALGMALKPEEVKATVALTEEEAYRYLAGETIDLAEAGTNGWCQVLVKGNGLGFAKRVGQTLKNSYPKGLRFKG